MSFQQLSLIPPILQALEEEGYTEPTPIQAQAIPLVLQKKDLLACAQTGTGKTAAFSVPMLQLLAESLPKGRRQPAIKGLILTPTRELAIQIHESLEAYGRHLPIRSLVIFGGVSQRPQTDALRRGVDLLVATPGRLLDLMNQGYVHLDQIRFFVLDEADRMLDMGFINDVKKVVAKLPQKRQSLFFSATMPPSIIKLSSTILKNPEQVAVTPVSSTVEIIQQKVYFVTKNDKRSLLSHVLQDTSINSALVFSRTKHGANRLVKHLHARGIKAEAIHGNKSQTARQKALSNFKEKKIQVLVATDIAARGIDVDDLSHVINFDLPNIPETYVHRIGRTGRAGNDGVALSFCDQEEVAYLKDIQKLIGQKIPIVEEHPYAMATPSMAGPRPKNNKPGERKAGNPGNRSQRPQNRNWRGRRKSGGKSSS